MPAQCLWPELAGCLEHTLEVALEHAGYAEVDCPKPTLCIVHAYQMPRPHLSLVQRNGCPATFKHRGSTAFREQEVWRI